MAARNAQSRNSSYLQKYLRSHSKRSLTAKPRESLSSTETNRSPLNREATFSFEKFKPDKKSTKNIQALPRISGAKSFKPNAENLPNEILSAILWILPVGDLIVASQVCRRWYRVAGDNLLWKRYYRRFVGPTVNEPEDNVPIQELDRCFWKNLCLKRCKVKRDQIYLKKWKKPDSYTGLRQRPELTLGKVGARFELSFFSSCDNCLGRPSHVLSHDDVFWLTTSASVRWYGLVFPDVASLQHLQIHSCTPLMFHGPSKPAKDGIVQKSLLLSIKTNLKEFMNKTPPLGEDEHVQLFELDKGLLIARYKVDNEMAFIMCVFHYHNLVSRCLSGAVDRRWASPKSFIPEDDIDPQYGLHGYSCVLILRNTRQKLLECKFSDLYTKKDDLDAEFAIFSPVRKDDKLTHVTCLKDVCFPWRTSLFKGIIQNVAILDMTLLGDGGEPFWTATGMVAFQTSAVQSDQFEFSPELYRFTRYEDEKGRVELEIGRLEDGTSYLSRLDIMISLHVINDIFHTSYGTLSRKSSAASARKKLVSAIKS